MKVRGFEVVSKFENETVKMPKRGTKFSAGYDIFNNTETDIILNPGELSEPITTKLKVYMLEDEYLALHVRSGHGFKYSVRLANVTGIIDMDYYNNNNNEGEIFIKLHNQGNKTLIIPSGDAMCQAIFSKYLLIDGDNRENLEDRSGGFGSTSNN